MFYLKKKLSFFSDCIKNFNKFAALVAGNGSLKNLILVHNADIAQLARAADL